jgi:hypothetical protein
MIVQRDVAPTALGAHLTWRDDICVADSFEYPNRYDWRYNHDIQGEPETIPLDAIAWKYLLDRCGRYKGCHQAHNAKVAICALFTTPNSLKLQERRKAFSPIRKVRAISQKLYSDSQPANPISV